MSITKGDEHQDYNGFKKTPYELDGPKVPFPEEVAAHDRAKKPKTLKDILDDFAGDTTAHGIPRIITRPSIFSKVFWLLLVAGAFYLFGSQTLEIIGSFYTYNTKIELVTKRELHFPAVTVCNLNRMKRSKLQGTRFEGIIDIDGGWSFDDGEEDWFFDFSSDWSENQDNETESSSYSSSSSSSPDQESSPFDAEDFSYSDFSWVYDDYYDWNTITDENDWQGFYDLSVSEDFSDMLSVLNPTWQELRDYGHQAEDFILQCTFDKRRCNYTDFKVFQNLEYGNCFTFNGKVSSESPAVVRNTTKSGSQYGLSLTLFIEEPEYVGLLSHDAGVRVAIHSNDEFPYPEDTGVSAGTGQATAIGIRQTELTRLMAPWGDCTDGDDGTPNHLYHHDYKYTQRSCEKKCLFDKMAEKCGCITEIFPEYQKPRCSSISSSQQMCRQLVEELYTNNGLDCDCPTPCHEIAYDFRTTTTIWPSERYEEHLFKRLGNRSEILAKILRDVGSSKKNIARLKIYFEDLNYQSIEQVKAYTIYDVLGSVGGLMGLYVGISVITLVEFMVLIFDVIALGCKRTFSRSTIDPVVT